MEKLKLIPEILLQRSVPAQLYGINPRTIKGSSWWDKKREEVYASTNYHCAACGVHRDNAKHYKRLEAHESFKFDDIEFVAELDRIVPLCHLCHNFIHFGRLQLIKASDSFISEVFLHGLTVLSNSDVVLAQMLVNIYIERAERLKIDISKLGFEFKEVEKVSVLNTSKRKAVKRKDWRLLFEGIYYDGKTNEQLRRDYK